MFRLALTAAIIMTFATAVSAASASTAAPLPVTMLENKVAYVRVERFTPEITARIRQTLLLAGSKKPRGIILDMRNNQGGDIGSVHAILEALLPKGTPYMRHVTATYFRIAFTAQPAVIKKSTPVVVLRDSRTVNEPAIAIYALQKLRGAGILEFAPDRGALKSIFKQHARMDQYRPIKEPDFFVAPDIRLIANEGSDQEDVIPRAIVFLRESSPWEEVSK